MTFRAIPAGNAWAGRRDPLIGAVTGKRAATVRMQRTARQGCIPPGLSANVFLAGEPRLKSKLHWPQARTAATVAGLLLSKSPTIVPQVPLRRVAVAPLRNPPQPTTRSIPPRNKITGGLIFHDVAGGLRIIESNNTPAEPGDGFIGP